MARDRYHHVFCNWGEGMYRLGTPYWAQFVPRAVRNMFKHLRTNESWDTESNDLDRPFDNSYITALVVMALGTPIEMLPIL